MKALSVPQPWAEVIARGEKTIEVRTWSTKHRGPAPDRCVEAPRRMERRLRRCGGRPGSPATPSPPTFSCY